MDPSAIMNEGSFTNGGGNAGSFNLSEIWQFPMNGGGGAGVGESGLGLRSPQFGDTNLSHFSGEYSGPNRDGPGNDPVSSEQGVTKHGVSAARKRRDSEDESTKFVSTSSGANPVKQWSGKRLKASGCNNNEKSDDKAEAELNSGKHVEENVQPPHEAPKDYIHVRARRGQATDSHSLAERARREKISERMKALQDLVPGCNKVIGKALVLDEIINYIQSLQRQVEFLSMKLEAVNTRVHPVQEFPAKDFGQQPFDTAGMAFGSQATTEYKRGSSPEWLHMQIGGGFERTS